MRDGTYCFGDVVVEGAAREVWRAGSRVALEPKALDVLLILLRDAGRVVEKRRLLAEVWADVHVTDSSLARAITQVRRAIGDDHRQPRFVETVPTRGYKFIGRLEVSDGPATAAAPADVTPTAVAAALPASLGAERRPTAGWDRARRPVPGGWSLVVVALGLVLATGGLTAWLRLSEATRAATSDVGARLVQAVTLGPVQFSTSRGADIDPAFSPDGGSLAYAADESGAFEILVRPRHAAAPARAVTNNGGDNVAPAWSPDGQWLAFHSRRFGGIWVVSAAGGSARQLVPDGAAPTWSPDGRTIAYQTAGEAEVLGGPGGSLSTLRLVDVATGGVQALTAPGQPAGSHGRPVWVSADRLVFVSTRVPAAEVWQVTRGGALRRLGDCEPSCRPFRFEHDGTTWLGVVITRGRPSLLLTPVSGADIDLQQASRTPLPGTFKVSGVTVSADGRHVAFSAAHRTSEVWSVSLTGGDVARPEAPRALLAERRPRYSELAFSPDGRHVAYTTSRVGDRPETWLLDLQTGLSRQLASAIDGFVKSWTPDGGGLMLVDLSGAPVVHRVDVTTGRAVPHARFDRWRAAADVPRRMFTLRLSPDLRRAFYTAESGGRPSLVMTDVAGQTGAPDRRIDGPLDGASFGRWSRDGQRIAFQASSGWRMKLGIHDAAAGTSRVIVADTDHAWPNDWSPGDRSVVFAAMRRGRWSLEVADARTGAVHTIVPPGGPAEYVRWPVWSPAGDRIAYERGYWTGNVWVATVPGT